ncbi:4-hydroxybenzoate 3-monooxygenase [Nocardia acidivorans]|uniref:4-hydroxybenzoate 3-monooxygenase n=1 Tax=Nocardia acidivorans TaxID=404580 RepID=UPI00082E313C|nr:4-hydroxybenzoate 3-monooxygenase [Nocardia acidivorans]
MRLGADEQDSVVLILGAGPAGLVLANILRAANVPTVVLERRTREQVRQRARAGFLAPDSVAVLREHGLAAGLDARGRTHDRCEFRSPAGSVELRYGELGAGQPHTVYPQQDLVTDLIAEYLAGGGVLHFGTTVERIEDIHTDRPAVLARDAAGAEIRFTGHYLAGCDGARGISRTAVPTTIAASDHGITWLALLMQAPPAGEAVIYGVHPDGFAGQMPRTAEVTRYYLQCDPGARPREWSDWRIWDELARRLDAPGRPAPATGPIIERGLVRLRSRILDPIQAGRLFLVGDAATSISPSAAKGANLAIVGAQLLAEALIPAVRYGKGDALQRYSEQALPRIRRAQEFSHWMIDLLHPPAGYGPETAYRRELQRARLHNLATSRSHQHVFADNYVGI